MNNMNSKLDLQIATIDKIICRHIENSQTSSRGMISQDILSQLRNFVEHIMLKFLANGIDIENTYPNIQKAINYVKTRGDLKVLTRFHEYLQIVASHYSLDEENSERLMLKYYEYLLRLKILCMQSLSLTILYNLEKFPLKTDPSLQEYYRKIADRIEYHTVHKSDKSEKYYIQKIKPFFIKQKIYYEVTFTPANDYASKFNRVIAFTQIELIDNYAVKLALAYDDITILGKTMPILVIVGWEVAIRDCEYKNFSYLIRGTNVKTGYSEQQGISNYLTKTGFNLTEIINFPDSEFQRIKSDATKRTKDIIFFNDLEACREIVLYNKPGANLIRYLLFHMNNKIIKGQHNDAANTNLSSLYMHNKAIPFDKMPFNTSPIGHNPRLKDLFSCIDATQRQHELLARLIRNNTEMKGTLFTPLSELAEFVDVNSLIQKYNNQLWFGHRPSSEIAIYNGNIFINQYKDDTCYIINRLIDESKHGIQNYSNSVVSWLAQPNNGVDCEEKKAALISMFEKSNVALIYGSAGTGKSTLINHIAHFFADKSKLFLAQTNPAVDNLKRRVSASQCTFSTIAKFLKRRNNPTDFDLLIIDECSTISNRDMKSILNKANFKLLVLVGDTYQISSIRFGNWFNIAKKFVDKTAVFELTKPYRTDNQQLLTLWDRVRRMDDKIIELIARQGYSVTLDDTIFSASKPDEIILCLNYDGLYGINNINRFLQESNPNPAVSWGIQQYKVGDPILFNESDRFAPIIYNNMKGTIVEIEIINKNTTTEQIQFSIELEKVINGFDALGHDFKLLGIGATGNSIIQFCVNKLKSTDEDDDGSSSVVVPFQVAYAVSIHKAQGLEYSSVKIVITNEVDELITHNIFYTAITRTQQDLKIYWTPEVERKILNNISPQNINKDVALLKKDINFNSSNKY